MSDETAPKLRLKPKLGSDAAAAPQSTSAAVDPVADVPGAPELATEGVKLVRLRPKLGPAAETAAAAETARATPVAEPSADQPLAPDAPSRSKPRLSAAPMEGSTAVKAATPPPMAPPPPMPPPLDQPEAPAEPAKAPTFKLGLKPKAAAAPAPPPAPPTEPAGFPSPIPEPEAAAFPPPAPVPETDNGENGEPAEITAMRQASSAPFPPPGKFPPPPGLKRAMMEAGEEAAKSPKAKAKKSKAKKKSLFLIGGAALFLMVAGVGFIAWQKFTAEPPPPPRKRSVAKPVPEAVPVTPAETAATAAKPVEPAEVAVKPAETILAETKPAETAAVSPEVKAVVELKPPSVAFRSWVENLQIRGLRAGANPRVFIGNSSYGRGDLVNPTLGIVFEGLNETTRQLIFTDKTGARLERRQ